MKATKDRPGDFYRHQLKSECMAERGRYRLTEPDCNYSAFTRAQVEDERRREKAIKWRVRYIKLRQWWRRVVRRQVI